MGRKSRGVIQLLVLFAVMILIAGCNVPHGSNRVSRLLIVNASGSSIQGWSVFSSNTWYDVPEIVAGHKAVLTLSQADANQGVWLIDSKGHRYWIPMGDVSTALRVDGIDAQGNATGRVTRVVESLGTIEDTITIDGRY